MANRPSERFCKHGFLTQGETYNPDRHNSGVTVEERCSDFYTPEEIARMNGEIRVSECAICMENLINTANCRVCSDGHKFHNTCLTDYWRTNPGKQNWCPTSNSIPTRGWQGCSNINDINSGGRRIKRKSYNKKRKTYKKNKKSYKKSYKKSKKRT
jgi:hypothetical protein